VVLHDNAENMCEVMDEAGVHSISCLAHALQLSVKAGLASQHGVGDVVSVCRRTATHFSHSTLARDRLREIQQSIPGLTPHDILPVVFIAGKSCCTSV